MNKVIYTAPDYGTLPVLLDDAIYNLTKLLTDKQTLHKEKHSEFMLTKKPPRPPYCPIVASLESEIEIARQQIKTMENLCKIISSAPNKIELEQKVVLAIMASKDCTTVSWLYAEH